MWEVQCGQAGHGSTAGPSCSTAALPAQLCWYLGMPRAQQQQQHPASELLTGHSQGWALPGEMVEGQFREQTGWQCCVPAVLPCPWNHPLPWQCPGQERLITQSCCPWSRAPRLRAHLCLPMARGDTPGDAMSPSSSLGPFCTCGSQMQRRTYPLTCKARLNKQEHDG